MKIPIVVDIREKLSNFGMKTENWQDLLIDQFEQSEAGLAGLEALLDKLNGIDCSSIEPSRYFGFTDTGKVSIAPSDVRVIILGESVSPSKNLKSLGYAFGTEPEASDSLNTLCKCVERDYGLDEGDLIPTGCLDGWISQGVLLMNVNIVEQEDTQFQPLIRAILRGLFQRSSQTVYLLFGRLAKQVYHESSIKPEDDNVLRMWHPAAGGYENNRHNFQKYFYDEMPFLNANKRLQAIEASQELEGALDPEAILGEKVIDWKLAFNKRTA